MLACRILLHMHWDSMVGSLKGLGMVPLSLNVYLNIMMQSFLILILCLYALCLLAHSQHGC